LVFITTATYWFVSKDVMDYFGKEYFPTRRQKNGEYAFG
jgi:hypothetical protein